MKSISRMNYLAHAYLSFEQPEILVGNMISDFVKGKRKYEYSVAVQNGIALHRAIDTFTDYHPATAEAKQFFRPVYRLYSAAFTDIIYDHFLANDASIFSDSAALSAFAQRTYGSLARYQPIFPEHFNVMFPYMKMHDWLFNYRHRGGIRNSFGGMVRRAAYLTESAVAFEIFETHHEALKDCYDAFFPSLKAFAVERLQTISR